MSLSWKQNVLGAEFTHAVTPTGAPELSPQIVLRVLCHFLINQIPERGLPSLFDTLKDFHEFYMVPGIHLLPATPSSTENVPVHVQGTYSTQAFEIAED